MFFLILLFGVSYSMTVTYNLKDLPPPATSSKFCRRRKEPNFSRLNKTTWICNPDEYINDDVCDWFDTFQENIPQENRSYVLASCWVKNISVPSRMSFDAALKYFARGLIDLWNVGNPRHSGKGIMIFAAADQVRIELDWGVQNLFSSEVLHQIRKETQEYVDDEDPEGALIYATEHLFLGYA